MSTTEPPIIIPYSELSPAALEGIIEEFVTRNGTELGTEVPLDERVRRVRELLQKGYFLLVFDTESETCSIIPAAAAERFSR